MKNNLIQFYSTILFFFISFMIFAAPGDDSDDPTIEEPEPTAPIDTKLYILVVLAIVFAFYTFRNNRKTAL